ncbi:MAG: hypothetical protein ABIO62_17205 [Paracoccaceae bacterium]
MSFDEPWADAFWEDLNTKFPRAHRVHGVKGLDACHKAAADAAGTDHFLTVDADTTVDAAFFDTTIPDILITPRFRLDWLSRNHVNGLVTGNGGLKFWSREMVMDMRTHEAAPQGTVSLDHEIGAVYPGESLQVTMPGVYAVTASAMTPYHAFRCGLRESVYLLNLMETTPPGLPYERHARLIEHWGSVGRHAQNGLWMIYGIRLGAQMRTAQAGFDATCVNDYDWITRFWTGVIMPRFGHGASRSPLTGVSWDEQRLNDEVDALGRQLATQGLVFADCDAEESARLAAIVAPLARSSGSIDALAEALLEGRGVRRDSATGHALIETAVMLGNPASCNKLARLHERKDIPNANIKDAERFFVNAMALGNPHAPWHLARLRGAAPDRTTPTEELDALIVLASARGFDGPPIAVLPKPRKIGPKPARFVDHVSIGVSMHGELRWRIPKRGPDHVVVLFENV